MKDWGTVRLEGCGHIMGWRDEEDAQYSLLTKDLILDMRKPLTRDPKRRSVRPNGRDINVSAREVS